MYIKGDWTNHDYPATRTYLTTFHLNINPPCSSYFVCSLEVSWWLVAYGLEEYEGKQYWSFDVSPIHVPKIDQFFVDKQTGKVYNSYGYEI